MKTILFLLIPILSFGQMTDSKFPASGAIQSSSVISAPATTGAIAITMTNYSTAVTITPSGACTFNAVGGVGGNRVTFIITTSGISSFVLTWSTNFKSQGTLATGTTSGKVFCITFVCKDGTTWCETGRTPAM